MQLDLTKQDLKTLLELVYLGDWMINAQRTGSEDDSRSEAHENMKKRIYAMAGEAGFEKEVKYDEKLKEWFPTYEFEMESDVAMYHNVYDNNCVYEQLPDRLAWRDLRKQYSNEQIAAMSFEEKLEKRYPFIDKYEEELYQHGLERLEINESAGSKLKIGRNQPCPCGSGKKFKKCCE